MITIIALMYGTYRGIRDANIIDEFT